MGHDVVLDDGTTVRVRPLRASDRSQLEQAFARLSDRSRYRRFLSSKPRLSESELTYLTEVDQHDHVALVAYDPASRDGIGVARFVRASDDPQAAEVAVAVVDDWQHRGVGRALLDRLSDRAREEGVTRFRGAVLAENREALGLLASLGDTHRRLTGTEVQLVIELPDERGRMGDDLAALLRGVASSVVSWTHLAERVSERARELYEGRTRPAVRVTTPDAPVVVGDDGSAGAATAVAAARELAAALGVELHVVSAPRDPAGALIDAAARHDAQLVVVGRHGTGGARRFRIGSVADKLCRHAPCNVLVVGPVDGE